MNSRLKLSILLGALCATPTLGFSCTLPENATERATQAFRSVNANRKQAGLHELKFSSNLARAAQRHACDSADRNKMSHTGGNGSTLGQRLNAIKYNFRSANENIAFIPAHHDVVSRWMGSNGHRVNILSRKTREIGFGLAMGPEGGFIHWVMVSGSK